MEAKRSFLLLMIATLTLSACFKSRTGDKKTGTTSTTAPATSIVPTTTNPSSPPVDSPSADDFKSYYSPFGADAIGLTDLEDAVGFATQRVDNIYCAIWNTSEKSFHISQSTPIPVLKLAPRVLDKDENTGLLASSDLIQLGAGTEFRLPILSSMPISLPNSNIAYSQDIQKGFWGKVVQNTGSTIRSYGLWSVVSGSPIPAKISDRRYFVPIIDRVVAIAGRAETYVGQPKFTLNIIIDTNKTLAQQLHASTFYVNSPDSQAVYKARCALRQ